MTGYLPGPQQGPLIVYGLNPINGKIQTSVNIQGPLPGADGFTVLPNGNFLINDNDAVNVYREYDALTGLLVPSAPVITVKSPTNRATGVDYFNNSLYFYGVFFTQGGLGKPGLLNTDLNGNEISRVQVSPVQTIEDISVIPEPSSLMLCVCAMAGLMIRSRRKGRRQT